MKFKMIKNQDEYLNAIKRFEEIFLANAGSAESDEADMLAKSIKEYEEKHFFIALPDVKNSDRTD
jgi:HTH-type transcriptional regulator/antitoxin HigA